MRLYKVNGAEYPRLDLLKLDEGETMTDMGVWIDGKTTLTLLLITFDPSGGLYRIEPWELRINKIDKNGSNSRYLLIFGSIEKDSVEKTINCINRFSWFE